MIVAIIQARTGSSRLPNKVLMEVYNKPLIFHMIDRVKRAKKLDEIVIATTIESKDDIFVEKLTGYGIKVFRGSENDVLDRYYQCACQFLPKIEAIVRITGDCPLIDPNFIDDIINTYLSFDKKYDLVSNSLEPTLPNGMNCELFSFKVLEKVWREAKRDYEREHVAPYIYLNPDKFKLRNIVYSPNNSHMRWTIDYLDDFQFIQNVFENLYPKFGNNFTYNDICKLLEEKPELMEINKGHIRNEKFLAQLEASKAKN